MGMAYELGTVLGEGSTAITFLAEDESGRKVVVKQFKSPNYAEQRWQKEAQALRQLTHPQIPKYIDEYVAKVQGRSLPHLVQEYVEGASLQEEMKNRKTTWNESRAWLLDLLGILEYLQSLHPPVIHRDIKPSNVIRLNTFVLKRRSTKNWNNGSR